MFVSRSQFSSPLLNISVWTCSLTTVRHKWECFSQKGNQKRRPSRSSKNANEQILTYYCFFSLALETRFSVQKKIIVQTMMIVTLNHTILIHPSGNAKRHSLYTHCKLNSQYSLIMCTNSDWCVVVAVGVIIMDWHDKVNELCKQRMWERLSLLG